MKRYWQKQYRRTKYRGVAADLPAHESRAWLTDCNFNVMRKSILNLADFKSGVNSNHLKKKAYSLFPSSEKIKKL